MKSLVCQTSARNRLQFEGGHVPQCPIAGDATATGISIRCRTHYSVTFQSFHRTKSNRRFLILAKRSMTLSTFTDMSRWTFSEIEQGSQVCYFIINKMFKSSRNIHTEKQLIQTLKLIKRCYQNCLLI
jgi:hypothetical protein